MPRNKFYADIPHEIHNMSRVAEADAKRKRQVVVQAAFECACRAVIILRFSVSSTHATKQEFHVGSQHHRGTYLPTTEDGSIYFDGNLNISTNKRGQLSRAISLLLINFLLFEVAIYM